MMFPYLRIGPLLIQMPGLALLVGLWISLWLVEKEAARLSLRKESISSVVFAGLIGGILAARLAFAAQHMTGYIADPLSLLSLNTGALSPQAGALAGLLIATLSGRRQRLPLRQTLDALAPGLAFFMIMFGLAHLLSGNAYGASTRLPWAIYLWSDYRHPTQVYEMILALITFAIVISRWSQPPAPGVRFIQVIALSSVARVFLEAFRGDSLLLPGGFRAAQVIGLLVLAICVLLLRTLGKPDLGSRPMA